ncbi:unnamed protein product [Effrenium voratum]|nr:unnamed protein product [Effrenium voratum]
MAPDAFRDLRLCLCWAFGVAALPEWLRQEGVEGAVDIVGVAEAAGSGGLGRSLRAAKDFAAGEEVLRVPLRLAFLEVEDAPTQPRLAEGRLLDELAVRLAAGRGEASVLHRLLPSQMPNHPLFYSDEVAQGWQRREKAAALGVTEQDFRWAHAALRSRGHAVRLRDDGRGSGVRWRRAWGLVPVADLLNWAPKSRCNVRCGTRYLDTSKAGLDGFFACTALGSVDRGAELFTEPGPFWRSTSPAASAAQARYFSGSTASCRRTPRPWASWRQTAEAEASPAPPRRPR